MVTTETIEGLINGTVRFHYDVFADVLYLRLASHEQTETYADQTDTGDLLLRSQETDEPVGLTLLSYWKRFGQGAPLPDSLSEFHAQVEPLAAKLAA